MDFSFILDKYGFAQCPEILYHYTGKEGFLGIIRNKYIWATHIVYQNDRKEFNFIFKIFHDIIQGNKELKKLWNDIKPEIFTGARIYTISFSEYYDIIEMWYNYASTIPGFCIAFDAGKLYRQCKSNSENMINTREITRIPHMKNLFDFELHKCLYKKEEQIFFIEKMIENFLEKNKDSESIRFNICEELFKYAPLMKNRMYEYENEWRIIIRNIADKAKISERVGKYWFIPYFELEINTENCFSDIYIGNCTDLSRDIAKASTEKVCNNNGIYFGNNYNRELKFVDKYIIH
jgi:hypothetical protein